MYYYSHTLCYHDTSLSINTMKISRSISYHCHMKRDRGSMQVIHRLCVGSLKKRQLPHRRHISFRKMRWKIALVCKMNSVTRVGRQDGSFTLHLQISLQLSTQGELRPRNSTGRGMARILCSLPWEAGSGSFLEVA